MRTILLTALFFGSFSAAVMIADWLYPPLGFWAYPIMFFTVVGLWMWRTIKAHGL